VNQDRKRQDIREGNGHAANPWHRPLVQFSPAIRPVDDTPSFKQIAEDPRQNERENKR
jgi:hypothetical protein